MTDQRQRRAAHIVLAGSVNRRDAPGGLCEPGLGAAFWRSMEGQLAAPGQRVSRDTYAPMPSRPRDGDELVSRERLRALAAGAKVEWKRGQTATRPRATNVRVI